MVLPVLGTNTCCHSHPKVLAVLFLVELRYRPCNLDSIARLVSIMLLGFLVLEWAMHTSQPPRYILKPVPWAQLVRITSAHNFRPQYYPKALYVITHSTIIFYLKPSLFILSATYPISHLSPQLFILFVTSFKSAFYLLLAKI